jgi:glutaredoxin
LLPHLFLYGRPGCHLCEEIQAGLQRLQAELDFTFATIDIDSSPELEQR